MFFFSVTVEIVKSGHALYITVIKAQYLTQPFQGMLSFVLGPCPEGQELCAALDIPPPPAFTEECDCQAISVVEVAVDVFLQNNLSSETSVKTCGVYFQN